MMYSRYPEEFDLDDPRSSIRHRDIILHKSFLRKIYQEWYSNFIRASQSVPPGILLELGSGGGFLKEVLPRVITSDILELPHVEKKIDAQSLPFPNDSIAGIFMINVFHHIPNPETFLTEALRTLKVGGKIIMIEPANSIWSRWIYRNFHHEPFEPHGGWTIEAGRPMSVSNQALPYIYFERDREQLSVKFPDLKVNAIQYHTPIKYILSGGVSRGPLVPSWSYDVFNGIEKIISPINPWIGLFATIECEKTVPDN